MNIETIVITDKELIQKITKEMLFNEVHLSLDHEQHQAYCFDDYTKFEIKWQLPYFRTKNILKYNRLT